jgi:ubiquitin C-terminal hydrolase
MNATLQCLLHVCELIAYFLNEYPNDSVNLKKKNDDVESKGNISKAFYDLVKGVISDENEDDKKGKGINMFNPKTSMGAKRTGIFSFGGLGIFGRSTSPKAFSPDNFKKVLGYYNPQFRRFEANDSKDLILYLLQTMHEELNYYGDVVLSHNMLRQPNQYNRVETFLYFNNTYNMRNFSIISTIFYGTYENITFCKECKNYLYNFQKFEFISFGLSDYHRQSFNIYQGFKDNQKEAELKGDNQFYCNHCRKLCNASLTCRIIQPPNKLLINLDYGKNKRYQPSRIDFDEIIDITELINFNFGCRIKYRIIGVCTHLGISGSFGHYIAYCRHRESGQWYNFNDSSCTKCNKSEIYGGSPYLLLYEKI